MVRTAAVLDEPPKKRLDKEDEEETSSIKFYLKCIVVPALVLRG